MRVLDRLAHHGGATERTFWFFTAARSSRRQGACTGPHRGSELLHSIHVGHALRSALLCLASRTRRHGHVRGSGLLVRFNGGNSFLRRTTRHASNEFGQALGPRTRTTSSDRNLGLRSSSACPSCAICCISASLDAHALAAAQSDLLRRPST